MTQKEVHDQVVYYKSAGLKRDAIIRNIKRRCGSKWTTSKIVWIDNALHGVAPKKPKQDVDLFESVASNLRKKIRITKRAGKYSVVYSVASESAVAKKIDHIATIVKSCGFALKSVRGDAGYYMHAFGYTKNPRAHIFVEVIEETNRKPYTVAVKLVCYR
jgi:hypothetical protein